MGRYWLTIADGSTFTLVRSSIEIAESLRRNFSEKIQRLPKLSAAELAVLLLTIAEAGWGKGKVSQMISQIVDIKHVDFQKKGQMYLLIRDAVTQLPLILWTQDKLPARREFIEELTYQISYFMGNVQSFPSKTEILEQEWRNSISALGKNELKQRQQR